MRIVECEQGSPEWFAARTGKVTASRFIDARATNKDGKSSQKRLDYMAELALERITGNLADRFVNDAMRRGTQLEPEARDAYQVLTGNFVTAVGICLHDTLPIGYSPDGLVDDDGLIEVKCPASPFKLTQLLLTRDVSEYMDQMQGGMWITGRKWCDLIVYHPSLPLRQIRIMRNDEHIGKLVLDLDRFMADVDEYTAQLRKAAA